MLEQVIKRLEGLGFPLPPGQRWGLEFLVNKVVAGLLADCNLKELPGALEAVAVERATGEALQSMKQSGALEGIDLAPVVQQWSEGDTSVTMAVGTASLTPEQRLDALIATLLGYGKEAAACHRRLRW